MFSSIFGIFTSISSVRAIVSVYELAGRVFCALLCFRDRIPADEDGLDLFGPEGLE
jgi:hypothetical protein